MYTNNNPLANTVIAMKKCESTEQKKPREKHGGFSPIDYSYREIKAEV